MNINELSDASEVSPISLRRSKPIKVPGEKQDAMFCLSDVADETIVARQICFFLVLGAAQYAFPYQKCSMKQLSLHYLTININAFSFQHIFFKTSLVHLPCMIWGAASKCGASMSISASLSAITFHPPPHLTSESVLQVVYLFVYYWDERGIHSGSAWESFSCRFSLPS